NRFSRAFYRPHRDAELRLHGLDPVVVPGTVGRALDRAAAARVVVTALAGFGRRPVALPVRSEHPSISAAQLDSAAAKVRVALSHDARSTRVVVGTIKPGRTTRQARSLGIHGPVGSYETIYGGDANRVHNVQLVARLLDGKLIAPGATFSFNRATGARTAAKG